MTSSVNMTADIREREGVGGIQDPQDTATSARWKPHWCVSSGEACFLYIHQLHDFITYLKQLSKIIKNTGKRESGSLGFTEMDVI